MQLFAPHEDHFCSSTFFNFQNVYSGEIPKFKKGTLEELFEELFVVGNGKWKSPHILHVEPLNEEFIIPLISFSSLWVSIFLKSCMVLSEYPTLHI